MEWDSVQAHLCGPGSYEGDGNASGARTYLGPHLFVLCIVFSFTPQACCYSLHEQEAVKEETYLLPLKKAMPWK